MKEILLQTRIKTPPSPFKLEWRGTLCGVGSCFSDRLLSHLYDLGFDGDNNPSGIIYNSCSIHEIIDRSANKKLLSADDFFLHNDKYCSWEHHGSFSHHELDKAIENANEAILSFRNKLTHSQAIILTPSSSVVYQLKETERIVANCHRVPNNQFERRILSVCENEKFLKKTVEGILSVNPNIKVIFTLSPVRHYPGELTLNARSKANLLAAIHNVIDQNSCCTYFPSYEILLDELRDYRFYNEDMFHPNDLARKIILQRFVETYFGEESLQQLNKAEKELRHSRHRQRN